MFGTFGFGACEIINVSCCTFKDLSHWSLMLTVTDKRPLCKSEYLLGTLWSKFQFRV